MTGYCEQGIRKLMFGVVDQAAKEARKGKLPALVWLYSEGCELYTEALGFDQNLIKRWCVATLAKCLRVKKVTY